MNRVILFLGLLALLAMPVYAHAAEEEVVVTPEFEYLELSPLTLPIITDQGMMQQVSLVVALEVPYGKKDEIKVMEPRLADAYLQDLYGALGAGHAMMRGNIIDVQAVKDRLTDVTNRVVGPDVVHGVLLQVLQQRRSM